MVEATPRELREFQPPRELMGILGRLREAGHEAWIVGGAVRDLLLGKAPTEFDVATDARPKRVAELFDRVVETGIAHGTVTVLQEGFSCEVTTYRAGRAYAEEGESFVCTIEEDLAMRDFTVNAMAYDPLDDRFLDPQGGLEDLRAGLLRAVGSAEARFAEDPLRPVRAARFAARFGCRIERRTRRAMPAFVNEFERRVAPERIGQEMAKLLVSPHPRYGMEILRRTGYLAVILPELLEGLGLRQNRWHRYDVYHHVLRALDAAPPDLVVRLAVLLHDVDKPRTVAPSTRHPGENTFFGHEVSGAKRARAICLRLRFARKVADEVERLVREHQFVYTEEWSDAAVRRMLARIGDSFDRLLEVRRADILGHGRNEEALLDNLRALEGRARRLLEQRPALQIPDLAIGGREVMQVLGIGPSPKVGEALRYLLAQVLEDPARNEPETLVRLLRERYGSIEGG
nr:MAG: hypothetical protein DIU72_02265 [Pseudomonadota bacterium]